MWSFSKTSQARLDTCHDDLQVLARAVIAEQDCTVICGHRNKYAQEAAVLMGNSKLNWPESRHNASPSMAIDLGPYPLDWDDLDGIITFAHLVMDIAGRLHESGDMTHKIRWGGDWNMDGVIDRFFDGVHFELV